MTTLRYGDQGWRVAEWQLAVGEDPTGLFSIKTNRATVLVQAALGLHASGVVDAETIEKHGLTPRHLRSIADPCERLLKSVDYLTRAGAREWNSLALMVTQGKRSGDARYDWNADWINYHARVCGVTWREPEAAGEDFPVGSLLELRDGRRAILVSNQEDRLRASVAPAMGAAATIRIVPGQIVSVAELVAVMESQSA